MVLKVTRGYSPDYLLKEVAAGRENYYTGAVTAGEPPGRWWGSGAEVLGLRGLVDAQDMRGVYERFLDPREAGFKDPSQWDEVFTLGHGGRNYLSEDELYAAAREREPDADAERRQELRFEAGQNARHNVAFFDLTYNVQKSITLVHTAFEAQQVAAERAGDAERAAAWGALREAVEDAIWAGNNAMLEFLNEKAGYSRVGRHGGSSGRWVDARDWVVGSFFQHDSREHDPHLHIHNAFLNRVMDADGVWRTVDGQLLYRWKRAAAAVAERVTAERLTHALGVVVAMREDGKAREVVGVAQAAMDMFSTRRRQLTAKTGELVEAFEARHGRAPNNLELERLSQQATLATRRAKSHTGETREEVLDRVDATLRADLDGGLAAIAHAVLEARPAEVAVQSWLPQAVIEAALEQVRKDKAGWTEADLFAAVEANLPDTIGLTEGADVARLVSSLTQEALRSATALSTPRPADALLPDDQRLADGASSFESPGARLYATPDHVHTERALVAATAAGGAAALPAVTARRFLDELAAAGVRLGADQAAAVEGVLTSGQRVECLVGPAGTGKSFVLGVLARAWTDPTHIPARGGDDPSGPRPVGRVFGLATSQIATQVLAGEGLTARNVTSWLATQARLTTGPGSGRPGPIAADAGWRLHAGDLVVVDESAMTNTADLAAIHAHVDAAGAKLLLVGDHRQLAAVGAGGMMALLADAGIRYELVEARRFTHDWERDASLRLREHDNTVLGAYHRHGRLLDSGTREQAEASAARAWLADTLDGRDTVLLVDSNDQAARLSGQLRAELVRLGRVSQHGVPLSQGTIAGVGDRVQARWNGWDMAGVDGNPRGPINRETYEVTAVHDNGALDVLITLPGAGDPTGPGGSEALRVQLRLPAAYVAEHLDLAYASTVHAAQGRTTDTSHAVITSTTSAAALYVGLSRGRDANTAHVATTSTIDDPARGRDGAEVLHRNPISLLAGILDTDQPALDRSATALAADSAAFAACVQTAGEMLAEAAHTAVTARTAGWLDDLVTTGALTVAQRQRLAAEDASASLGRLLRRVELAGDDARQVLTDAVGARDLDSAHNATNVLVARITDHGTRRFAPTGGRWADWVPDTGRPDWDAWLAGLAAAADARSDQLAREAVDEPPGWALTALGPVPEPGDSARATWQARAGVVAGYRELRAITDTADPLGLPPSPNRQAEAYAAYRAAWDALGRPETDRAEYERSRGYHRRCVIAWEREQRCAPRYVGNELAGTRQAAQHHRQTATLRHAEADTATDPDQRADLAARAAEAAAIADTLDSTIATLEQADTAYLRWRAHSAGTRAQADISGEVLAAYGGDDADDLVTAEEWLAAHDAARAVDEADQPITDLDLADDQMDTLEVADDEPTDDLASDRGDDRANTGSERASEVREDVVAPDLREIAAREPRPRGEDEVGVPATNVVADTVTRSRRILAEIAAREAWEQQAAEHERDQQLSRWHDQDRTATRDDVTDRLEHGDEQDQADLTAVPTLERS